MEQDNDYQALPAAWAGVADAPPIATLGEAPALELYGFGLEPMMTVPGSREYEVVDVRTGTGVLALGREEAEQLLRQNGASMGMYLLRRKGPGAYALSLCVARGAISHFLLTRSRSGGEFLLQEDTLVGCTTLDAVVASLGTGGRYSHLLPTPLVCSVSSEC